MERALIEKVLEEARSTEANLVIADRRDTFTIEAEDLKDIEVFDDYLRATMDDGKITVYLELEKVYKLVLERQRSRRIGGRAGFSVTGG